jgi:PleD family two-component response regulator
VLYKRLLPGSQVVGRLQDLNYRVETLNEPDLLVQRAESTKPILVLADLKPDPEVLGKVISQLKKNASTSHLPVLVFGSESKTPAEEAVAQAGASLVVSDSAIVGYLPQLLEQVLRVD